MKRWNGAATLAVVGLVGSLGALGACEAPDTRNPSPPSCELPSIIRGDLVLESVCNPVRAATDVTVDAGATLTIHAGVKVEVSAGKALRIADGGTLRVLGTANLPVVLTGSPSAPESWAGIVATHAAEVTLQHVEVNGGGQGDTAAHSEGCVTVVDAAPGSVALESVSLARCAQAGLALTNSAAAFARFEIVRVSQSEAGVATDVASLAGMSGAPTFDDATAHNVLRSNPADAGSNSIVIDVTGGVDLPAWHLPWHVAGDLEVRQGALTLAPGAELRFGPNHRLRVGIDPALASSLVADGTADAPIVLGPIDPAAEAGSWIGLTVGAVSSIDLAFATIEGGGRAGDDVRDSAGDVGCVTIGDDAAAVRIHDVTFARCAGAGVALHAPVETFAHNTFRASTTGIAADAHVVGSIETTQTYDDVAHNLITSADVGADTTWSPHAVPWEVAGDLTVSSSILTLAAGLELRFGRGHALVVGHAAFDDTPERGGLVAHGTAESPVVLTSSDQAPVSGGWDGVFFGAGTQTGTILDHVSIADAGNATATAFGTSGAGCVTVAYADPMSVSIVSSSFAQCAVAGIKVGTTQVRFAAFGGNRFDAMDTALAVPATMIASIEPSQTFGPDVVGNVAEGGAVTTSQTWRDLGAPWRIDGDVSVGGFARSDPPVTLRIEGGTYAFRPGAGFEVGMIGGPAALEAVGVDFTVDATQGRLPWAGFEFGPNTTTSSISRCTIQDAGESKAAVELTGVSDRVSFDRVTFSSTDISGEDLDEGKTDILVGCGSQLVGTPLPGTVVVDRSTSESCVP